MYKQIKLLDHYIIAGPEATDVFSALFSSGDYKDRQFFLLADKNTEKFCLPELMKFIPDNINVPVKVVEAGEKHKNLNTAESLWQFLVDHKADRDSVLVNLGGGVITDIGGFAASTFKRGISYINIPTTLMAMVDAAIGGKTAVNTAGIKNAAGTFHQPDSVYIYPRFLNTLPREQLLSGYAEILKYALIMDRQLWSIMRNKPFDEFDSLEDLITFSVLIKAEIVEKDPAEKDLRKILNFGHTFGHAFEALMNRRGENITHGHAVAAGIICETYLSAVINDTEKELYQEVKQTILGNFSKLKLSENDKNDLVDIMLNDKKNKQGKINFSLLTGSGKCRYDQFVPKELIIESLNNYLL